MSHPQAARPPLRVLHLEDNLADAELVRAILEDEWSGCSIRRVQTRDDFLQAVLSEPFGLILSDFSLPQFNGLAALTLAAEHAAATPFIFLSGAIGEERAIEALKRGASDYIIKDRPGRLLPAIRQALARVEELDQRRRSEGELRNQSALLHKARDAIIATDLRHYITFWNATAERMYGWSAQEVSGKTLLELGLDYDRTRFSIARAQLAVSGEWRGDFRLRRKSGESIHVETTWSLVLDDHSLPQSILMIDTDVTARKKLEAQVLRADRMDTIGMLAGGVAHDLNNVLAPILIGANLLREDPKLTDPAVTSILDTIANATHHGAALVRQLTTFARGGEGEKIRITVGTMLEEVRGLLRQGLPATIQTTIGCSADAWSIQADPTQIQQLLLNLCFNARDAMPEGGELEIRAENTVIESPPSTSFGEARPGPYLQLSVRDTGTGIPPEILEKIFDPFFTTKAVGKGTGLGLSTVAGIIKSHDGFIKVESVLGRGTVFRLFLPACLESSNPASNPAP